MVCSIIIALAFRGIFLFWEWNLVPAIWIINFNIISLNLQQYSLRSLTQCWKSYSHIWCNKLGIFWIYISRFPFLTAAGWNDNGPLLFSFIIRLLKSLTILIHFPDTNWWLSLMFLLFAGLRCWLLPKTCFLHWVKRPLTSGLYRKRCIRSPIIPSRLILLWWLMM